MSRSTLRIILITIAVLLVIGIAAYFILSNRATEQSLIDENGNIVNFLGNLPQSGNSGTVDDDDIGANLGGVGISDAGFNQQVVAEDIKKRSIIFIERLGSYSSDSVMENVNDVFSITTASLELKLRDFQSAKRLEHQNSDTFEGYTVTAVTARTDVSRYDEGIIEITINAIREITGTNTENRETQELYVLTWVRGEDGAWRVNAITGDY